MATSYHLAAISQLGEEIYPVIDIFPPDEDPQTVFWFEHMTDAFAVNARNLHIGAEAKAGCTEIVQQIAECNALIVKAALRGEHV